VSGWWLAPALACLGLAACATPHLDTIPAVRSHAPAGGEVTGVAERHDGLLRIMTLNVAHGRGESFHQLLQATSTTRANLDNIARLLQDSGAHVVALQEADGPSFWSGNFSHIDYLARNGRYRHTVHGAHADGIGLSYGTALLARLDLRNPRVITFDPEVSAVPKGFVVSTVDWPGRPGVEVDIVSLHLDFASSRTRRQQAQELIDTLQQRDRPVIVTGDFNIGWSDHSIVRHICTALGLDAWRPAATGLETFPALGERLDWILVSRDIAFRSYRVMPEAVSDHRGVIAELALVPGRAWQLAQAD
jgi:endonuclease/exonuclease/phosphatase family metal-dependent hydrolase